ncbi:MAG: MlaD family protein [Arenicellales bacterium]
MTDKLTLVASIWHAGGLPRRHAIARLPALAGITVLSIMLAACGRHLQVQASFKEPTGLATGTPIYLGDARVGTVSGLTTDGVNTTAELSLDPDRTAGLRAGSAALLTTRGGATAIELHNYRPGSDPLKNGTVLVGLNGTFEYAAWQAGEALDTGKQSMDELAKTVTGYFQSEEWRRRKDEMNHQLDDLRKQLGESFDETGNAYRNFLNDLESQSREAQERARQSYAELTKRLRKQIRQLEQQGNEKLVKPLQDLLDELSRPMKKQSDQEEASARRPRVRLIV